MSRRLPNYRFSRRALRSVDPNEPIKYHVTVSKETGEVIFRGIQVGSGLIVPDNKTQTH